MKTIDEALLDRFRRGKRCEWCGGKVKTGLHPHHLFARGMGGAGRLDVAVNLIALCPDCHRKHHDGNAPTRPELVEKIALREGKTGDEVLDEIHRLLRGAMK